MPEKESVPDRLDKGRSGDGDLLLPALRRPRDRSRGLT